MHLLKHAFWVGEGLAQHHQPAQRVAVGRVVRGATQVRPTQVELAQPMRGPHEVADEGQRVDCMQSKRSDAQIGARKGELFDRRAATRERAEQRDELHAHSDQARGGWEGCGEGV